MKLGSMFTRGTGQSTDSSSIELKAVLRDMEEKFNILRKRKADKDVQNYANLVSESYQKKLSELKCSDEHLKEIVNFRIEFKLDVKPKVVASYQFPLIEEFLLSIKDFNPALNARVKKQVDLLQNFYETTLGALKETKNERLWFKTNLKLGKLYEEQQDYVKLQKILKELHKSCQTSEGKAD